MTHEQAAVYYYRNETLILSKDALCALHRQLQASRWARNWLELHDGAITSLHLWFIFCFKCIHLKLKQVKAATVKKHDRKQLQSEQSWFWHRRAREDEHVPEHVTVGQNGGCRSYLMKAFQRWRPSPGGGLSHWYHWRYYRFLSIYMQERHRSVLKGYLFLRLSIVPAKEPSNHPQLLQLSSVSPCVHLLLFS